MSESSTEGPRTVDPSDAAATIVEQALRSADAPDAEPLLTRVLADALTRMIEGGRGDLTARVADFEARGSTGPATIVGFPGTHDVITAIAANSALMHTMLTDDAHAGTTTHPGSVILPLVLALGEETDASGAEAARAIIGGYEALMTAATASSAAVVRGWRATPTFGPIGAAVAAGMLLGLTAGGLREAVLIAAGNAGGTLQAFRHGSTEWRTQGGTAAAIGLVAARWAAAGIAAGASSSLDRPGGLYTVLRGAVDETAPPLPQLQPLENLRAVTFKTASTCGANQVPVALIRALIDEHSFSADDIEAIDLDVSMQAFTYPVCENAGPFEGDDALLSRPLAVAAAVFEGGHPVTAEAVDRARRDPRLHDLVALVTSRPIPDGDLPDTQWARATVRLRDGRELTSDPSRLGSDPLRPTVGETLARLSDVADVLTGDGERAADAVRQFERHPIRMLLRTLRPDNPT